MKNFSTFLSESISVGRIDGIKDSINYIGEEDLKKYLEVANIFLSEETKQIIQWLIVNNKTYSHITRVYLMIL